MEKFNNLREIIENSAKKYANNIAFREKKKDENKNVYYDDINYTRLKNEIEFLGRYLLKNNLGGKRIAVIGKNSYEWMLVYLSVVSTGGVIVPLDRGLMEFEINEQLSRSGAEAIFYAEAFKEIMSGKENIFKICMDDEEFNELLKLGAQYDNKNEYDEIEIDNDKMSALLFTSGTTSQSKAVMLSQKNIAVNVSALIEWEKFYETDVNMAFLPLHHTFGITSVLLFLSVGMCNVFCEGLRIQKCLNEYGVTVFVGVPRILEEIYRTIQRKLEVQKKTGKVKFALALSNFLRKMGIDISRKLFKQIIDALGGKLRFIIVGAAPATPEVLNWFNKIGILSVQGYGLTETAPVLSAENDVYMRASSVGKSIPGVELKVVNTDENGIGEIIARGENVMLGYFDDEENTSAVIKDGWFYTGDMGRIDNDGYIFISGRKKNVIVLSNGKNVFPEEIESLVSECNAIKECLVYASGDEILLKAVRDTNFEGDCDKAIEEHIKAVNEKLIHYKQIKSYTVSDEEMEKTTTGKIKRYK